MLAARPLAIVGVAILAAACGGDGGTAPRTVGSISITPANPPVIPAGGVLQLSVTVRDTEGEPMSGQSVSFSTSAPAVATVSTSGQVSAAGPIGVATITASVGSVSASVPVTVVAGASASITTTSSDPGALPPGATAGDSVRFVVRDAFGNPRVAETVSFSVAAGGGQVSPATARTDAQGRVATVFITGTAEGTNTLNASVGGVSPTSFSVTTVAGSVAVSSIAPSPMTPGATVTIAGAGFDPTATGNSVTIDGQAATVTSATSTRLEITVPMTLPCTPSHQATVTVTANGVSAIGRQTLRVGALHTLAVGSAVVLTGAAEIGCTELSPASGRYAVNVLNPSTIPTAVTPFQLSGAISIPPGSAVAAGAFTLRQSMGAPAFSRPAAAAGRLRSISRPRHNLVLEANRRILTGMKPRFRRTPRSVAPRSPARASVAAAVPVAVGDTRKFRVVQFSGASVSCATFVEITARAVYVGTKGIVYEDVAAPLAGQMDSHFTQLGEEFDTNMYSTVNTYFADPLVTDGFTDGDQHLNMVFTPSIPEGLGGFVISCDFFERNTSDNQASNFGENFYARVPTVAGTGFNDDTADRFLWTMRSTIVHEVKHIAGFGARLVNGAGRFEESWLEEGMAVTAEEMWARDRIYPGATWKGNLTYASTLHCEVRPSFPDCAGRPLAMFDAFADLYSFLDKPGSTSLFGRVTDEDFTFYGVSWSFIRYNVDRYAASETDYLRGITNATGLAGIANIVNQSAAAESQIVGMWSLTLYLDENNVMAGNADVRFPSWETRDIFAGMNLDFPQQENFPKPHPLVPQPVTAGDFSIEHAGIHGGSFSAYDLRESSASTRTIRLSSGPSGGSPPLHIVIARIQ
ncbi:MAG TPA: IPT/TIG domain-containing protein [Gemmatimonadaceae bacterium]|nr:IPT/TIG domain-containing protein [Gemmatimonadaceae bacterium]